MTDDNSNASDSNLVDIDLDEFSAEFFEQPKDIEIEDTGDDASATDEDKDAPAATGDDEDTPNEESEESDSEDEESESDDDNEESDEEEDEEEPKSEDKGKNRKSSYQERINELTRARREAERREAALLQRLEALERREREVSKEEPIKEQLPQGAPDPEALNEKGEPLYPLGEYDPNFIKDLTRFTIEQETKALKEKEEQEAQARQIAEAKEALKTEWNQKLDAVEEEIPEIREHIVDLVETFQGLDPAYGEYLAMTIMQSENGPHIMEYLSQNIGEAQKIVASGPAAATLMIGRLDARLTRARPNDEERHKQKKVSSAPTPPEQVARGRKGQPSVRPDTDDLDAFEREFYRK